MVKFLELDRLLLVLSSFHCVMTSLADGKLQDEQYQEQRQQSQPDPNLVPIINELLINNSGDVSAHACSLHAQLGERYLSLQEAEDAPGSRAQVAATMAYIQNRLGELEGVKPCKKLSATKLSVQTSQRQSSAVVQEIGDEEANEIEKEEEQQEEETKEADEKAIDLKTNEEGLGLGELCEDCAMDYNSSELRGFFSMFKKAFNESADDSLAAAETKIMRIVALSATGAIILVVLLTLALAFALRLCMKKIKSVRSNSAPEPVAATFKSVETGLENKYHAWSCPRTPPDSSRSYNITPF